MHDTTSPRKVTALLILDGWGINTDAKDNAVAAAAPPFLTGLEQTFPTTRLNASGNAVGLPDGVMGNSEVGHMNIGAGRQVFQDLVRINRAIADGSFFDNPTLLDLMARVKKNGSALHLMGLLSDGGVHSHMNHLFALMEMATRSGLQEILIHPILDGRDTPPKSGIDYLTRLTAEIEKKGYDGVRIATLCGRFYAMDRDTRWDRVAAAYRLYTQGEGAMKQDPLIAIQDAYDAEESDEFVKPVALTDRTIRQEDGVLFFNFRADRAREIASALTMGKEEKNSGDFPHFKREVILPNDHFVCMTQYDESFSFPVIFPPQHLTGILGGVISHNGLSQLRIAETEKYAHVTYFFNGGDEKVFPGEERILIPSPREVTTYDEKPEMSAPEVTKRACQAIRSGKIDFMVLNFANMDMVGHTGNMEAAILACRTVDQCVKEVVEAIWETSGVAMVTADHGNAEEMRDKNGNPHTAHTLNPVRFILAGDAYRHEKMVDEGILGDIAPTILKVLSLPKPSEMTGTPLF